MHEERHCVCVVEFTGCAMGFREGRENARSLLFLTQGPTIFLAGGGRGAVVLGLFFLLMFLLIIAITGAFVVPTSFEGPSRGHLNGFSKLRAFWKAKTTTWKCR